MWNTYVHEYRTSIYHRNVRLIGYNSNECAMIITQDWLECIYNIITVSLSYHIEEEIPGKQSWLLGCVYVGNRKTKTIASDMPDGLTRTIA